MDFLTQTFDAKPIQNTRIKKSAYIVVSSVLIVYLFLLIFEQSQLIFVMSILFGSLMFHRFYREPFQNAFFSISFEPHRLVYIHGKATLWFLDYQQITGFEVHPQKYWLGIKTCSSELIIYTQTDSYMLPLDSSYFTQEEIQQMIALFKAKTGLPCKNPVY
ncbi:hypothetical protein N7931_09675 [Catenovulum sp. 2E275]|uniref:hypothetical protein n=1 Tax=Catenovulum sp. 2E275 TaxID=2980497 RepID=UPI0021D14743|nr:hypothetical protein [Catenovulum sp. 2E275]MCU4675904.1 hypothetical protein [Catenovulum sp. 2E275]